MLKNHSGNSVFPVVDKLPKSVLQNLIEDNNFRSEAARAYDMSWQAIYKGYIGDVSTYSSFKKLPVSDNYIFIRKYFHSAWVFYVLVLRILSFKNPFNEVNSWFKTRHVKRYHYENNPIEYNGWKDFNSDLVTENPLVSVVIPTLNRYHYLKDVLADFEKQDYSHFEIIVVDQSEPLDEEFYNQFNLNINLIKQEEKALWLARNNAVKNAKGTYIALSEDDVRINKDWISSHLKCLDFFDSDISAGVFYPLGKSIPKTRSYFSRAPQFATGNAMLKREVFKEVGLFDRQFEKQRMGDGEFGLRTFLKGIKSVSNPFANCIDVKASTGGLRELGSWDAFRPSNFFAPRPIPSVVYFFRKYFGNNATRMALLRTVPFSIFPYQVKKNKPLLIIAALLSILIIPLIVFQVWKSWNLASKKLDEGALITHLK